MLTSVTASYSLTLNKTFCLQENIEKSSSESEQDYYTRILTKHSDESDEEYSERLQLMMEKLSHLSIWKNNEYVKYQQTKQYSENKSSVNQVQMTEVVQQKQEEHHEEHHEEHQEAREEHHEERQEMREEHAEERKEALEETHQQELHQGMRSRRSLLEDEDIYM